MKLSLLTSITVFAIFTGNIRADGGSFSKSHISDSHKLFRWPTESVGTVRQINMGDGTTVSMITKSTKPAVFYVEDFLSEQECDQLVKYAEKKALISALDEDRKELERQRVSPSKIPPQFLDFNFLDENKNGQIDLIEEVQSFAYKFNNIYLNEFECTEIFKIFRIDITTDRDKMYITRQEFSKLDLKYFFDYLNQLKETHPVHGDRVFDYHELSLQTSTDPLHVKLFSRLQKVTNLDPEILKGMEPLEITKFDPYGHHFSHFESDDREKSHNLPCCHLSSANARKRKTCRNCRFLSFLVYLNEEGGPGETVFPVADDPTYSYEKYIDKSDHDLANLVHHCDKSKLIILPKKGSAVFWYNHDVSPEGILGKHDHYSLQGECNVYYNVKWVAYARIVASDLPQHAGKSVHRPDYKTSNEFEYESKKSGSDL